MSDTEWLGRYLEQYQKSILAPSVLPDLISLRDAIMKAHAAGRKIIFAGNGGSAAMSSHCAVDFTKVSGIRAVNFNEADLITCFANDYGYENWITEALRAYADPGDVIVLISSSGKSPNIVNAAKFAVEKGYVLATFTGFSAGNALRQLGKINLWVDSSAYNIVENTHIAWLLAVCDLIAAGQLSSQK